LAKTVDVALLKTEFFEKLNPKRRRFMEIVQEMLLPSGLTIILAPSAGTETITGVFATRAGWKYENRQNCGIAHFLEHMAFKGTRKRPTALDITKEVDSRGGRICEEKVSAEELQNAKDYLIGSRQMALEASNYVAYDLTEQWALTGRIETPEEKAEQINMVSRRDVQEVAQEIFVNNGLNLAIVSPPQNEEKIMKLLSF
jgi:predicted Zn-dependent peptidase